MGNTLTLRLLLSLVVIALAAAHQPAAALRARRARGDRAGRRCRCCSGCSTTTFVAVLQARLRMGRAVVGDVAGRAVALGLVVLVAALDLGFYAVLGAAAGGALATLAVTWLLTRRLAAVRPRLDPAVWRRAAARRAAARAGARGERALLPRRHADHLALRALRRGRPLHARLPHARADARVRHDLPHHELPGAVRGRGPRRAARARARSSSPPTCSWSWACRWWPAGWCWRRRWSSWPAARTSTDAAEPLRILLAAGALAWVNGVFGYALIAKDRQRARCG